MNVGENEISNESVEDRTPSTSPKKALSKEERGSAETNGAPKSHREGRSGDNQYSRHQNHSDRNSQAGGFDGPRAAPMEVLVDNNIEKAMKVLKRKLIKEGLFKELKARRYFEKPSERKKRKHKESIKKVRKDELRAKRNSGLFS